MNKEKEIKQLCEKCAKNQSKRLPPGHYATFWEDTCDICGKYKEVAAWHDFGYNHNEI